MAGIDVRSVMWDLNYFKYCFLKPMGMEFDESALEDDFEKLTSDILDVRPCGFMYRDFQSRNIMVQHDEPWLIDFQGGRRGPVMYDAVSFLWQARAGFSQQFRDTILSAYVADISAISGMSQSEIASSVNVMILFRMLQVLGAYGFRGAIERKPAFMEQVPQALDTCCQVVTCDLPELYSVLHGVREKVRPYMRLDNSKLTVRVTSFSYKKGIPEDDIGNGGGFVFDCRAIHNPGRYEPYKQLTGDDLPVITFLERHSDIASFLAECYALVDASVEKYIERGFTSLSVNFGCTGGQHRSVYSATHLARHLHDKYGVRVLLDHREQGIIKEFKSVTKSK